MIRKVNNRGYTMVELVVVMVVFVLVIIIAGSAFSTLIKYSSKLSRSEESSVEGVTGLEMFRHDLEIAGFGLLTSYDPNNAVPEFNEATVSPANLYNDGQGTAASANVPRAITGGDNLNSQTVTDINGVTYKIIPGTDYLSIKSTSIGTAVAAQKWTYTRYTSSSTLPPNSWSSAADNITSGSWVIMLQRTFSDTGYNNQLVVDNTQSNSSQSYFSTTYKPTGYTGNFAPQIPNGMNYIYGIADSGGSNPSMPFNRADYFIARPTSGQVPARCSNATVGDTPNGIPLVGTLYKATVSQSNGKLTYVPMLDCVADFQVILGWDTTGNGMLDTWSTLPNTSNNITTNGPGSITAIQGLLASAISIQNSLKEIKVFVLAQDGKLDPNYTSPSTITIGNPALGETSLTRPTGYPLTDKMLNYRWKVYEIIARPKNLLTNQ